MIRHCPQSEDAAAHAAGELAPSRRQQFEAHLANCPVCQEESIALRRVFQQLHAAPTPAGTPRAGIAQAAWAQARHEESASAQNRKRWTLGASAGVAAALALGALAVVGPPRPATPSSGLAKVVAPDPRSESLSQALDWFCRHQESDGSWSAEKWGGNPQFEAALTGLPVIALLEGSPSPERRQAARRAVHHLQRLQRPDGTFGAPFGTSAFVQGVSTCALLCASHEWKEQPLRQSAEAAVQAVLASQLTSGGWAPAPGGAPLPLITHWHREALVRASDLDLPQVASALQRADAWLASQPTGPDSHPPDPGSALADFHQAYFTIAQLGRTPSSDALALRQRIQDSLIGRQTRTGEEAGTWEPTDQWSRAGGRLYSTALATLALR